MPKYKVNNKTYNLPEDKVESFLLRFPDAIAIKDEPQDFPTSTVEDADAVQQPMTASQAGFTESPSVDTPSESQDTEKVEDVPLAPADPSLELQPSFPFSVNGYQVTKEEFEQYEQDLANQDKIEDSESFYTIPGYVDFFSDMHRSWKEGLKQSEIVEPAFDLLSSGGDSTDKEVADFVNKNKEIARKNLGSAEMKEFDRIYEEEGGGFWGFIKGAYKNPSVLPSMLISSVASQAGSIYYSNQVKAAAAAGAATGAAVSGLVQAIACNQQKIFPCSTLLDGEYGLHDLCIGVPVVLGKNGIEKIVEIKLSDAEKEHLNASAEGVTKTNGLLAL